jgi:quinone-modifying oxidoreductase, subunit QmoC
MAERVNAGLSRDLEKFGKGKWNECFHCGNCTATCPLAEQGFLFPRKGYLALQMGLTDSLSGSIEPWLCYFCGDCSDQCPRDAHPSEIMMVLRRYLTSIYDWTGLSKKFYTSHWWELAAILLIGTVVTLLFGIINPHGIVYALTDQGGVRLNAMFPVEWVHLGDWVMAAGISFFLVSNIARMWYFSVYKDKSNPVSLSTYILEGKNLALHFATQLRFNKCESKTYWASHWFLMTAYTTMFTMIVLFLPWFQTDKIYLWYHPQRLLGYYATIGLFTGLVYFFTGRIRKSHRVFKFAHVSDWLFIIMLFLTTLTGILLHFFRIYGMPAATYYMYIIHMAILVPMLVVEVPFSKWSHLAYRPFAVYFARVKKRQQEINPAKS